MKCLVSVRSFSHLLGPHSAKILLYVPSLFLATAIYGAGPAKAPNFSLLDQKGAFHELAYQFRDPNTKAVLLFVHGNGCPIVRKRLPDIKALQETYGPKGIRFFLLNANAQDTREEVAKESAEFSLDLPILLDESQVVARELGIERTGEALLIAGKERAIVYRGAIDDRLSYQKERPSATTHPLAEALESLLAGKEIAQAQTEAPGCKISFQDPAKTKDGQAASYSDTIAPILKANCVQCHTQGGLGPFPMSNHGKVQGWAEMIKEVLLAKQMPPWQADAHVGHFSNGRSLAPEETRVIIGWINSGCPRGDGADPLEGYKPELPEWGVPSAPDQVIALPKQSVEEKGVFPYRYVIVDSPFPGDAWIRAVQIKPGNTRVLHHVIVASLVGDKERSLAGYAPGMGAQIAPPNTAIKIPQGAKLRFQLHYTASGKPEEDETRLGIWLANYEVKKEFKTDVLINQKFLIPAGAAEHPADKSRVLKKDILLYSMNPHMHYRGKRMSYEADLPDGTRKELLSVPNYHFNWQRDYYLADPIFLPKGSKLSAHAAWDNSASNPHNPDPTKDVRWGDQSFEEMFFASYKYVEADPPAKAGE